MIEKVLQRLQNKHKELQEQYDRVSENIRCLAEDHLNETRLREKLRLKRELKNEEEERDSIEQEMLRLEMRIKNLSISRVYDELSGLDCDEHLQRFEEFFMQYQIGAFLLHGCSRYGVRFLLKQILERISSCIVSFHAIKIKLPSIQKFNSFSGLPSMDITGFDVGLIWNELGREVRMTYHPSPVQIASRLSQKWQKEHIVLILEVDRSCDLKSIIHTFWLNLMKALQKYSAQTDNVFLLLILVDDSEYLNECDMDFVETCDEAWTPTRPVKLPPVERYCAEEIKIWMKSKSARILPFGYRGHISQIIQEILEHSDNGFADQVLKYICTQLCQCEFNEGVLEEWLKF